MAWYGDMDLTPHLAAFLAGGPLDIHVVWGAPIAFEAGTDRKRATALAEASVREAVQRGATGRPPIGPVWSGIKPAGMGGSSAMPEVGLPVG